jgi:hypothetical protein
MPGRADGTSLAPFLRRTLDQDSKEEHDMQAVVGVVRQYAHAEAIVAALRESGIPDRRISVLSPGSPESAVRDVPTTDAEQPGIGGTIGSVVGGAAGTAGGLAVASLALPGVGPVIAAGAIALGLIGAVAGGALGGQLDDVLSKGLPTDELYVYRHALRTGRTVVIAMVDDDAEAERVRGVLASRGAESVDAAREDWWIGLRDAEEAEYTRQGGDFRKDEAVYRLGFDAAFRQSAPVQPFDEAGPRLRDRHGPLVEALAFRAGYERGRVRRAASEKEGDSRPPTDGPTLIAALLACLVGGAV